MKYALLCAFALLSSVLRGIEVSVDTVVANAGQQIAVPIRVDSVLGAANIGVRISYDPQVLVFLSAEEGTLTETLADDYVVVADESEGTVYVAAFGDGNVTDDLGGTLATLVFQVREGTGGMYSDLAVIDVQVGERTGVKDLTIGNPIATANGMVRAQARMATDGIEVVCTDETLAEEVKDRVREAIEKAGTMLEGVRSIAVKGPEGNVSLIADLGIAPAIASAVDELGTLEVTYSMPTLSITSFDPETGVVKIKVVPGEGNTIVSELATGYLHVYGTSNLAERMERVAKVGFDLTPYLKPETKGEAALTVELGTSSFLQIRVE